MRKLGISLLIIAVVVVLAALILPHLIDVNKYHATIKSELEKRLGRPVALGNMHPTVFPPRCPKGNTSR